MRFRNILFFLLCFSQILPAFSQKEGIQWYFGRGAGLYFEGDTSYAVTWGQVDTDEGSSAISNPQGQLLFSTAGAQVYNKDHVRMPNGFGLSGHTTTTQSNMAVPWPENPDLYFIITAGGVGENFGSMQYSIIDMSEDDGKGDVVARNFPMFSPSTEKMAAIPHSNGCDYWIIGHEYDSRAFRAYLVDKDGISANPVVTNVGSRHEGRFLGPMNELFEYNAMGWLSVSQNGKRLATAIFMDGVIEVFDFDPATGVISNPIRLPFRPQTYGLAFSPDGNFLYASQRRANGKVYQMDLSSGIPGAILGSQVEVGQVEGDGPGAIQRGPDGKLYIANFRGDHLSVIRKPNNKGTACEFIEKGVYLKRRRSGLGLPVVVNSHLVVPPFNTYNRCVESVLFFNFENPGSVATAQWNFGDPDSGPDNTSTIFTPKHTFTAPGTYQVSLIRTFNSGKIDTAVYPVEVDSKPIFSLGRDTILCEGDMLSYDVTNPGKNVSYLWQDGSTDPTYTITQDGFYQVSVTNSCGTTTDNIAVAFAQDPVVDLGPGFGLCPDSVVIVEVPEQRLTSYVWQDGSTGTQYIVEQPGLYAITASNACGVDADSMVVFEANCDCELFVPNVFTPNNDGINDRFETLYPCRVNYYRMMVFDRWGREVFRSEGPENSWDGLYGGSECAEGTYYYSLEFEGDPRVTTEREIHKGALTLMR